MKRLEVTVVADNSEKVEESLKKLDLFYTVSILESETTKLSVYSTLVPDEIVDEAINDISQKIDLRIKENMVSVYNVEAYVSTFLDRLKEKTTRTEASPNPLERLVTSTERYNHVDRDILMMTLFATLLALTGLFLDNVVIVIGAMLLSPLLGPINAFAVNASLGRVKKLATSQFSIIALLTSVILLSTAATFITSCFVNVPINTGQIIIREHASLTDIGIALILGFAGGAALLTAIPEILVGVAIAVAILPPAVVTGIGLALFNGQLFLGAFLLTLVYLVGLQLGSTLLLRLKGVSPRRYYQKTEAKTKSAYSILILATLLIILGLIVVIVQP